MSSFDDDVTRLTGERRELLDLLLSREPTDDTPAPYVAPRTELEHALAEIWTDVLETDRIGIDDDYFALGGDSILAIVVVAKAQQASLDLSTHDLFQAPTIRQLAERVAVAVPSAPEPSWGEDDEYPLTPMQQGMLFHALDDRAGADYLVQVSCRLEGDVDADDLSRAWQLVADRNPALRAGFRWDDHGARQVVHPRVTVPCEVSALGADELDQRMALARYLTEDRRRRMDPARPPLLRVALFRLPDGAYHCVFTHHHLLLDGWSQQLLLKELLEIYDGLADGGVPQPSPRLPFSSYLEWLGRQDLTAAERFWREQLAGFVPSQLAGVGTDCPSGCYRTLNRTLSEPTGQAVAAFARRHRLTLSTLVQGGWALLLAKLTGAEDVAFGVTFSGRPAELPGVTEAMGMFINTLPARVRLVRRAGPASWLDELQRAQAELQRYLYTPLPLVERCRRDGTEARIFDTLVVVENFPSYVEEGYSSRRLRVAKAEVSVEEGYPLVLEVRPGPPVRLRLRYNEAAVPAQTASGLLAGMGEYLELLATGRVRRVADLLVHLEGVMARATAAERDRQQAAQARRLLAARRQPAQTAWSSEPDG